MGTGCTVNMVLGAPPALGQRGGQEAWGPEQTLGRWGCQPLAPGLRLILQVNLLTWWLWMAAGETGSTEELRSSLRHLVDEEQQNGLRERAGLHPQLNSTNLPGGACLWLGKLSWAPPPHVQGQELVTGSRRADSIWPIQGGLHQLKAPSSCLGGEMWLEVSPGLWDRALALWFIDWGLRTVGTEEGGDQRQKARKTSGEEPERRQRGLLPKQDPCELICSGQ